MHAEPAAIHCEAPRVIDGDTIRCANLPVSVRLAGIDAPELPGHCRQGRQCTSGDPLASSRALARLLALPSRVVVIIPQGGDRYGRIVARVKIGRIDLSCAQISGGFAVRRYGPLTCG